MTPQENDGSLMPVENPECNDAPMTHEEIQAKIDQRTAEYFALIEPLRVKLEATAAEARAKTDAVAAEANKVYDAATQSVRDSLKPMIDKIEREHNLYAHREIQKCQKALERLNRARVRRLQPFQDQYDKHPDVIAATEVFNNTVKPFNEEANMLINKAQAEFNEATRDSHAAYIKECEALEARYVNTPVAKTKPNYID